MKPAKHFESVKKMTASLKRMENSKKYNNKIKTI